MDMALITAMVVATTIAVAPVPEQTETPAPHVVEQHTFQCGPKQIRFCVDSACECVDPDVRDDGRENYTFYFNR